MWANKKQNNFNIYNVVFCIKKIKKNTCRYHYQNLDVIYSSWDIEENIMKLVILGHFLPFYPHKNPKRQNFEKWKNFLETSSFYACVPKIIIIWSTVPEIRRDRQNFLSFWAIFCPFIPPDIPENKNFKIEENTWGYYNFTHLHHRWQSYGSWGMEHNRQNFLSFWTIFCTFTQAQKIKILEKWATHLKILSFFVPTSLLTT